MSKTDATPDRAPEYGAEKTHDVPWNEKKVKVLKTLKKLGATSPTSARSSAEVAKASGLSPRDVRHYCYHAKVSGLTGLAVSEDIAGYGFYLTGKGAKTDFDSELKKQKAVKSAA